MTTAPAASTGVLEQRFYGGKGLWGDPALPRHVLTVPLPDEVTDGRMDESMGDDLWGDVIFTDSFILFCF